MISCTMTSPGEAKAWQMLESLDPPTVCRNAAVLFDDTTSIYTLTSFCGDVSVSPGEREIIPRSPSGAVMLGKYGYFFVHACLWYLVSAKDIPCSGRHVKPQDISGGNIFFSGSHILPLASIEKKYGGNKKAFIAKGKQLCAEFLSYGDAAVKLLPMPRIPVIFILWLGDDEFPPRADMLVDSTAELHLPIDIIWSVAMLSTLMMA